VPGSGTAAQTPLMPISPLQPRPAHQPPKVLVVKMSPKIVPLMATFSALGNDPTMAPTRGGVSRAVGRRSYVRITDGCRVQRRRSHSLAATAPQARHASTCSSGTKENVDARDKRTAVRFEFARNVREPSLGLIHPLVVIAGLVPAIHVFLGSRRTRG
jgi:hypothetical protein